MCIFFVILIYSLLRLTLWRWFHQNQSQLWLSVVMLCILYLKKKIMNTFYNHLVLNKYLPFTATTVTCSGPPIKLAIAVLCRTWSDGCRNKLAFSQRWYFPLLSTTIAVFLEGLFSARSRMGEHSFSLCSSSVLKISVLLKFLAILLEQNVCYFTRRSGPRAMHY